MEFDLEKAKAGHPVQTRDGRDVRILCFDRDAKDHWPIIGLVRRDGREIVASWTIDGQTIPGEKDADDLMMKPIEKEGWVNIYENKHREHKLGMIHDTKAEAKSMPGISKSNYLYTAKIEWEEEA